MDLGLESRVVLVAGGRGYVGSAVARQLGAEGATVVVASREPGPDGVPLDLRDQGSVDAAVRRVLDEHGRIDGLVVSAAPSARTLDPARHADPVQIAQALDAKALGFVRLVAAVTPAMRSAGYGRVVGISGQNAYLTGNLTGALRNAALVIAAKGFADDLAGTGVTVNTVNPGPVTDEPSAQVPAGGPGESSPEQIAALVTFLVSPLAAAVSGEAIAVGHRVRGAVTF
ncbi:SDR family NAD(P)-dependent oxidoreductase [Kineococcus aurantiacus]|uniref:NAD(P)-dependent dehydrogenase (Short-subunit alcohol dehydrogenase family) n=1 Tax=Kineococcus aurantiacus TaxID=37633 RepID=A0A7Y9DQ71_9ACTN|nr:SDR family oxidoreductase [Kineococcus aurantiacus]NYD24723.1 NAD(P)-dependent dehydrogenase (short-subunit alcohol dehydrogenase family) [Kineococcus aurantiacus]